MPTNVTFSTDLSDEEQLLLRKIAEHDGSDPWWLTADLPLHRKAELERLIIIGFVAAAPGSDVGYAATDLGLRWLAAATGVVS